MSRLALLLISLQKDLIMEELVCGEGYREEIIKGFWDLLIVFLS
jgi:hypothetical protein